MATSKASATIFEDNAKCKQLELSTMSKKMEAMSEALEQAQVEAAQNKAELEKAQRELEKAQSEIERYKAGLAQALSEVEKAKNVVEKAHREVEQTKAEATQHKAALEQAKAVPDEKAKLEQELEHELVKTVRSMVLFDRAIKDATVKGETSRACFCQEKYDKYKIEYDRIVADPEGIILNIQFRPRRARNTEVSNE